MFRRLNNILIDENRVDAFDFVRALAAMSVILIHFGLFDSHGVDIDSFFILSGFLVPQILCKDIPKVGQRYIVSRFTKVIPSYFFFLIVAFAIGKLFFDEVFGENLPNLSEWKQYFFFYRNYGGLPNRWAFEHVWTICVEEHFYVLILGVSFLFRKKITFKSRLKWFAVVLIVVSFTLKLQALFTDIAEYPTYTHNRLDSFGLGILLLLYNNKIQGNLLSKKLIVFILGLTCLGSAMYYENSEHELILRMISPFALSMMFIYMINLSFPSIFKVIAYYSYNAYLWHNFIVIPIMYYLGFTLLGFLIYILLTALLAFLTTHFIEDFFINRRKVIFQFLFTNNRNA